jgi:phosphotriesterase-related protein
VTTAIVRTVVADVSPDDLGFALAHEHLIAHVPEFVTEADLRLSDETEAAAELALYRAAGGGALVEMTTIDYGRDAPALARLQAVSGIHVIAATGFNKARFADRISERHDVETIAAWMEREIETGTVPVGAESLGSPSEIRPVPLLAGLIKASSSLGGPTPGERNVFTAAARAQGTTGAPISTHTEKGTWAVEQARLLLDLGVTPDKILLSHLDLKPDLAYHLDVLATGVRIGLDQFGKSKYLPDAERLDLVEALASRGFLERIMLSGDMARRSAWISNGGGPGLVHIPTTIRLALIDRGFGPVELAQLFERNAAAWLAFHPRKPRPKAWDQAMEAGQ